MEYIVANLDWLEEKLKPLQDKSARALVPCFILVFLAHHVLIIIRSSLRRTVQIRAI